MEQEHVRITPAEVAEQVQELAIVQKYALDQHVQETVS